MSTRQPSLLRKAISVLASFALAIAFVPIAWATEGAEGGAGGKSGEQQHVTVSADNNTRWESVVDGVFIYSGGTMTISDAGFSGGQTSVEAQVGTTITVTLTPKAGYQVTALRNNASLVSLADVTSTNSKIFTLTLQSGSSCSFEPVFDSVGTTGGSAGGGNTSTEDVPSLKFDNALFQSLKFSYKLVLPEDTASAPKGDSNTYGRFVNVASPSNGDPVMVSQFVKGSAVTIVVEPATANTSLKTLVGDVKVREGDQPSDRIAHGGSCVFDDTNNKCMYSFTAFDSYIYTVRVDAPQSENTGGTDSDNPRPEHYGAKGYFSIDARGVDGKASAAGSISYALAASKPNTDAEWQSISKADNSYIPVDLTNASGKNLYVKVKAKDGEMLDVDNGVFFRKEGAVVDGKITNEQNANNGVWTIWGTYNSDPKYNTNHPNDPQRDGVDLKSLLQSDGSYVFEFGSVAEYASGENGAALLMNLAWVNTMTINIAVAGADQYMLSGGKATMDIGTGKGFSVDVSKSGAVTLPVLPDKDLNGDEERYLVELKLQPQYIVPEFSFNGHSFSTYDSMGNTEQYTTVAAAVPASEFKELLNEEGYQKDAVTIHLTVDKVVKVDMEGEVSNGPEINASFNLIDNGSVSAESSTVEALDGKNVTLDAADVSSQGEPLDGQHSAYKINMKVGEATESKFDTPISISVPGDFDPQKTYKVVREHTEDGVTTNDDLDAAVTERGDGERKDTFLTFSSEKFSKFSIVEIGGGNNPPSSGGDGNNSTRIQLDNNKPEGSGNGLYDDAYKQDYGTIYYSTNYKSDDPDSATWTELNDSLKTEDGAYDIPSSNVVIRIVYSENAKKNKLCAYGSGDQTFKDGAAVSFNDGHIEFIVDNNPGGDPPSSGEGGGEGNNGGSGPVAPPYVPSTPAPHPQEPPIANTGSGDSASATVDVTDKVTTTESGSTQVAVDADLGTKIVENAVANKVADVVIKAETTAGASTETAVALPASTVKELAEKTEASVTISTDSAQVTLDKAAVAAVAEQAGEAGSVQLVVQTSEQNKNKVQIEVTLQTSNGNVSDFRGGNVTISVPVTEELAAKKIVCVYIDANGKYTKMPGALSADGKSYVFSTGHFSTYAVMTEEEANAAIAEQEKAEAAALAAAKPAAPSVKLASSAKGKLTVKASAKKAKGYRVYYKKAGWKAYKTYTTSGTVKALSKTFKKLSKGSYTVKVRAFGKTAAGKIAWGAKSKAKKVAVK